MMGTMETQPTIDELSKALWLSQKRAPVTSTGAVGGNLGELVVGNQDFEKRPAAEATSLDAAGAAA